eukprot:CFRG6172T1
MSISDSTGPDNGSDMDGQMASQSQGDMIRSFSTPLYRTQGSMIPSRFVRGHEGLDVDSDTCILALRPRMNHKSSTPMSPVLSPDVALAHENQSHAGEMSLPRSNSEITPMHSTTYFSNQTTSVSGLKTRVLGKTQDFTARLKRSLAPSRYRATSLTITAKREKETELRKLYNGKQLGGASARFNAKQEGRFLLNFCMCRQVVVNTDFDDTKRTTTLRKTQGKPCRNSRPDGFVARPRGRDRSFFDSRSSVDNKSGMYNGARYTNVEMCLFNDALLLVQYTRQNCFPICPPLFLNSLAVTGTSVTSHHHQRKFDLIHGDSRVTVKVNSEEIRDNLVMQIQGALEWLDTVDSYTVTLAGRDSTVRTRLTTQPFPETRTSLTDTNVEFHLGVPIGHEEDSDIEETTLTKIRRTRSSSTSSSERTSHQSSCIHNEYRTLRETVEGNYDVDVSSNNMNIDACISKSTRNGDEIDVNGQERDNVNIALDENPSQWRRAKSYEVVKVEPLSATSRRPHASSAVGPRTSAAIAPKSACTRDSVAKISVDVHPNNRVFDDKQSVKTKGGIQCLSVNGDDIMMYSLYEEEGKDRMYVLAATVEKLVERLADEFPFDSEFANVFLISYQSIIDGPTLIRMLIGRFNSKPRSISKEDQDFYAKWKKPIQTKVLRVILMWVWQHWSDFASNDTLYQLLTDFVPLVEKSGFVISSFMLNEAIANREKRHIERTRIIEELNALASQHEAQDGWFASNSERDIAEAITLLDSTIYSTIPTRQLLYHIWPRKPSMTTKKDECTEEENAKQTCMHAIPGAAILTSKQNKHQSELKSTDPPVASSSPELLSLSATTSPSQIANNHSRPLTADTNTQYTNDCCVCNSSDASIDESVSRLSKSCNRNGETALQQDPTPALSPSFSFHKSSTMTNPNVQPNVVLADKGASRSLSTPILMSSTGTCSLPGSPYTPHGNSTLTSSPRRTNKDKSLAQSTSACPSSTSNTKAALSVLANPTSSASYDSENPLSTVKEHRDSCTECKPSLSNCSQDLDGELSCNETAGELEDRNVDTGVNTNVRPGGCGCGAGSDDESEPKIRNKKYPHRRSNSIGSITFKRKSISAISSVIETAREAWKPLQDSKDVPEKSTNAKLNMNGNSLSKAIMIRTKVPQKGTHRAGEGSFCTRSVDEVNDMTKSVSTNVCPPSSGSKSRGVLPSPRLSIDSAKHFFNRSRRNSLDNKCITKIASVTHNNDESENASNPETKIASMNTGGCTVANSCGHDRKRSVSVDSIVTPCPLLSNASQLQSQPNQTEQPTQIQAQQNMSTNANGLIIGAEIGVANQGSVASLQAIHHISPTPLKKSRSVMDKSNRNRSMSSVHHVSLNERVTSVIKRMVSSEETKLELFQDIDPITGRLEVGMGNRYADSPQLKEFIYRFNYESYWVATEICTLRDDTRSQARYIVKFFTIAKICISLRNYYGAFAIMGGLRFPPVRALKEAWRSISPAILADIKDFETTYMNPASNMKSYRKSVPPPGSHPALPFVPLALKDLVFINDGNKKLIPNTKMYNFDRLRRIAETCQTLTDYKRPVYKLAKNPQLMGQLQNAKMTTSLDYLRVLNTKNPPPERIVKLVREDTNRRLARKANTRAHLV